MLLWVEILIRILFLKCYRILQGERWYVNSQTRLMVNLKHQAKNTLISWNRRCKSWQNHLSVYPFLLCELKTSYFIVFSSLGWDLNDWDPFWYMWPLHSITTSCNSRNLPNHCRQNFVLHDVLFTNCLEPSNAVVAIHQGNASLAVRISLNDIEFLIIVTGSLLPEGHVRCQNYTFF